MIYLIKKNFFTYIVILIFLFLFFLPGIFEDFIFGDPYIYFDNLYENKKKCTDHDQFVWLISLGRSLAAVIDCQLFKYTEDFNDIKILRFLTFISICLSSFIFFKIVNKIVKKSFLSILFVCLVFSLPCYLFIITIHNFSSSLSILFGLIAYLISDKSFKEIIDLKNLNKFNIIKLFPKFTILNIFILFFSSILYVTGPSLYLSLFILKVFDTEKKNIFLKYAIYCIPAIGAFFLFIIHLLLIHLLFNLDSILNLSGSYSLNYSLFDKLKKIFLIFNSTIPSSIMPWNFFDKKIFTIVFLIIFILSLIIILKKKGLSYLTVILLCFITANLHYVLSNFPLIDVNRLMLVSSMIVFLYFFLFFNFFVKKNIFAIFLAVITLYYVKNNHELYSKNIENAKIERDFAINNISSVQNLKHIYLIKPENYNYSYNNYKTIHDEFFIKILDRDQFSYFFLSESLNNSNYKNFKLYECDPQKVSCDTRQKTISFFTVNKKSKICNKNNYLILDFNNIFKKSKKNYLDCERRKISFYYKNDPLKMGISHAFDNIVSETSFFETGINKPVEIIFSFEESQNKFSYEIFSGDTDGRLPIGWDLKYYEKGIWKKFKSVNLVDKWSKNSSRKFEVELENKYKKFKIIFNKVNSLDQILRIYELKVDTS